MEGQAIITFEYDTVMGSFFDENVLDGVIIKDYSHHFWGIFSWISGSKM